MNYKGYQVIIHAAGEGSRLQSVCCGLPKALVDAKGKPLIMHMLEPLASAGFKEFILTISKDKGQFIRDFFKNSQFSVSYVEEATPLGRAGAVRLGIEQGIIGPEKPTIIGQCDDIVPTDIKKLIKAHEDSKNFATVVLSKTFMNPYGAVHLDKNRVTSLVEKPDSHMPSEQGVSVGMFILNNLKHYADVETPSQPEYNIYPRLASEGKMGAFLVEKWFPVNTKDEYKRLLNYLEQK